MRASPEDTDAFLAVARIVRPQGRRGEVAAEILTDFPERFQNLRAAYLENPGHPPEPARVENAWPHKGRVILKISGIDSIAAAARLRGRHVLIPRAERMPLAAHQYYVWELAGCRVLVTGPGGARKLGTVVDLEPTGGVDLLRVKTRRGEVLIPLAQDICKRIDPETKTILIDPPEDLLELNKERRRAPEH